MDEWMDDGTDEGGLCLATLDSSNPPSIPSGFSRHGTAAAPVATWTLDQRRVRAMKIAIPTANGRLCQHFGHCETFAIRDNC